MFLISEVKLPDKSILFYDPNHNRNKTYYGANFSDVVITETINREVFKRKNTLYKDSVIKKPAIFKGVKLGSGKKYANSLIYSDRYTRNYPSFWISKSIRFFRI